MFGRDRERRQEALLDLIANELVPAQREMLNRWDAVLTDLEALNVPGELAALVEEPAAAELEEPDDD